MKNNTYLSLSNFSIFDIEGNPAVPILPSNTLQVTVFTPDLIPPSLSAFSLDLDDGKLVLTFDETMNVSSFNITQLYLQGISVDSSNCSLSLTEGTILSPNSPIVIIKLSNYDLNLVKRMICLATQLNDSYIFIGTSSIQDMNMNFLAQISRLNAFRAESYVLDTTRPQLTSFDLDLNEGSLFLHFDETINTSTLILHRFVLSNSSTDFLSQQFVVLTGSSLNQFNSPDILIYLNEISLNFLKTMRDFATVNNNTFLSIFSQAGFDLASPQNEILPITLQVNVLITDTNRPRLVLWYPDIDKSTFTLVFNEPIKAESVLSYLITVQSQSYFVSNSTDHYLLSGGSTSSQDGKIIIINVLKSDLDAIKRIPMLLSSINNSFISFPSSMCVDIAGNQVLEINRTQATAATLYISDIKGPRINDWSLDMDSGIISLTFSEPVNISSIMFPGIGLQSTFNSSQSAGIRLRDGIVLNQDHDTVVYIQISRDDLNLMKQLGIGR